MRAYIFYGSDRFKGQFSKTSRVGLLPPGFHYVHGIFETFSLYFEHLKSKLGLRGNMEEYLTTDELSSRIKMAPGTIRNLVWKKTFVEGVHFIKPTPRKLLFVWGSIERWLHGGMVVAAGCGNLNGTERSLINI